MSSVMLSLKFVTVSCYKCGLVFALEENHQQRLVDKAETVEWYCPNGHGQHYLGRSKDQQIQDLQITVQQKDNAIADERRRREALEKRIKRGVCIYCKRNFPNIARHMECKHGEKK